MNALEVQIARYLAAKAMQRSRVTYQMVGDWVGWGHPTGRGLGPHLEVILHELADRGLPALTLILVPKGKTRPDDDTMGHIRARLGDIDVAAEQERVFDFDWSVVPELATWPDELPVGRQVWLTSFWGFDPADWGCIGFANERKRNAFLRATRPGVLVAIYVTKGKGPEGMRGKLVGVLEVSHEVGPAQAFIAGDRWAKKEADPESRGKWSYAVRATRAWRVVPEDWRPIEEILPTAYASADPQYIGSDGVSVPPEEAGALLALDVYEVPVYGQSGEIDTSITTLERSVSSGRAGPVATRPFWVGEPDGPRHLYIFTLEGDLSVWLGRSPAEIGDRKIIKVGFSKSPLARRDQIQWAYPRGTYVWKVFKPEDPYAAAPWPCGDVARAGEDAMKARLVDDGAEKLDGEFYLAEDWSILYAWSAGQRAAKDYSDRISDRNLQITDKGN